MSKTQAASSLAHDDHHVARKRLVWSAAQIGAAKAVKALLTHLKPGTTHHFRVVARTASGKAFGKDMTFKTKAKIAPVFTG